MNGVQDLCDIEVTGFCVSVDVQGCQWRSTRVVSTCGNLATYAARFCKATPSTCFAFAIASVNVKQHMRQMKQGTYRIVHSCLAEVYC